MAYFVIRGSLPGTMSTIPCDSAEAVCTKSVEQASTSSPISQDGPTGSGDSSGEGDLSICLEFLDDNSTLDASPSPNSIPSSPALHAVLIEADTDISSTSAALAAPPSRVCEIDWSTSTAVSVEAQREFASRFRTRTMPQATLQLEEYPAGLTNTAPVHRLKSSDSGRVKGLLKAKGLSVRTQGLERYQPFSRLFQPGGDVRCDCAY